MIGRRLRLGQAASASLYADVLIALAALVAVPYLVRTLGTEPYGILGVVSVLSGQLGVLHFGVGTAATRLVADARGRGGEGLVRRLAGVGTVAGASSLLVGGVFFLLAPVAWREGFNLSAAALPVALAAVPAATALVTLTPAAAAVYGVLAGRELFLLTAVLRVVQGVGRMGAAVTVVWLGYGVAAVFWAQALVDVSVVAMGALRGRRIGDEPGVPAAGRDHAAGERAGRLGAAREVLTVGLPFALAALFAGLLMDAEKLAVGMARSVADFTLYAVPFNVAIKFTVVAGAVARVLTPRIASLTAAGGQDEAVRLVERADRVLLLGTIAVLAPFIALTPELLDLWLGADTEFADRASLATRVVLVGILANGAALPPHAALLGRGRPVSLTYLYAAELALHLVVVYALVSLLGITGAGIAWTVRVLVDTVAHRVLAARTLGRPLGDGARVWGAVAVTAAFLALVTWGPMAGSPALRAGAAALLSGACVAGLALGSERAVLLDSVLPWRWGGGPGSPPGDGRPDGGNGREDDGA